ncbi:hypothetical protein BpHYR1_004942 [Brachionus plicatilis]|uniref:Uncharacterized protein n=1 Tax=Brachionus plicatilis TaxID=10195 RepID=A0A3M7S0W7_BRAPC|nr:hypothetical protein BpHYR1_004942 [Brachionus plicatilis]
MAGQILENREVAGQLTDPSCADRPATKRIKNRIYYILKFWISKNFFLDPFGGRPAGLHTVGRLAAFQLAGHHTVQNSK